MSKANANKGKLLFHDEIKKYTNDGKVKSAEEMVVHHAEDTYYAKYFKKAGAKSTKIEVKASGAGGEYTLMVTKDGGEKKTSTHNKTEITEFLKKDAALKFMLDYLVNNKALARARKTSNRKTASKSKTTKSKSKSKAKRGRSKSKSKAKRSKSKSKSKSKASKSKTSKSARRSKSKSKAKKAVAKKAVAKKAVAKRTGAKRKAASKGKAKRRTASKSKASKSKAKRAGSKAKRAARRK